MKELPNFMRKYYLISELLIFKNRRQNIFGFQYNVAYCSRLSGSDVVLWEPVRRSRDRWWCRLLWAVWGIPTCSSLITVHCTVQVLSKCFASSTASASHSRPVWRLVYCSTGQRSCHVTSARETVQLLTCETSDFIAPALWPANSPDLNWTQIMPDLVEASQPDAWRWPAEVTPDRQVETFPPGVHRWSDQAVASTSSSLHSSIFRRILNTRL